MAQLRKEQVEEVISKWQIKPMEIDTAEFNIIEEYFLNTRYKIEEGRDYHIKHYNPYQIINIFKTSSIGKNDEKSGSLTNRKLLWHGTYYTEIPNILMNNFTSSDSRKGQICFTDRVSQASVYSTPYSRRHFWGKIRFILLCEVALGET